jgi:DNA-binding GntR family transcriptional regulator
MTLSQPILPHSLVEEAFERIAEAIADGEIKPGERVLETQLARQLGISRAVLREALQRLESLWLVTRTPNVGVYVMRPTQHDLYELYNMLEALEGLAARLAAGRMSDQEIGELGALIEMEAQRPEAHQIRELMGSDEFHCRLARWSGNSRLERMVCGELRYQLRSYSRRISVRPGWSSAALNERRDVLAAIESRDPDRAESAMRTHIRHWRANLLFSEGVDETN